MYVRREETWAIQKGLYELGQRLHLPQSLQWKAIKGLHDSYDFRWNAMHKICRKMFSGKVTCKTINQVCPASMLCTYNSPQENKPPLLIQSLQLWGSCAREEGQLDFIQLPPCKGFQYVLRFTDTFIGWVESFLTWKESAQGVSKSLLKEILPRFVLS